MKSWSTAHVRQYSRGGVSSLDAINTDISGASGPNGVVVREGIAASLIVANYRKGQVMRKDLTQILARQIDGYG